jgi:copper resistance protein B
MFLVFVLMCFATLALADQQTNVDDNVDNDDNAWKFNARLGKLETQRSNRDDDRYAEWFAYATLGQDPHALWLMTKGATREHNTESAELRLFYAYTIAPHIGVQIGWKRDIEPQPERDWLGFGLIALLPFKIGADASFFIGESDSLAARLEVAYAYTITPKLSLTPDIEVNLYQNAYPQTVGDSTSSDFDFGLRLRYRVTNGISPYVGITWKADVNKPSGSDENLREDSSDTRLLLGISAWF